MKTKVLFFLMLLFFPFLIQEAKSQCLPDCFNDAWGNTEYYNIQNDCGIFGVEYSTRFACGMYFDVEIRKIFVDYIKPECKDMDKKEFINMITLEMLMQNPMEFPPDSNKPGCQENWRVMTGGCWVQAFLCGVGNIKETKLLSDKDPIEKGGKFISCSNDGICCLEFFKVCYDEKTKVREITNTGYQPSPEKCENPYCFPTCGTIYR